MESLIKDTKTIYSDINRRVDQKYVENYKSVEQSITNIIMWKIRTRKFLRSFGSEIDSLLLMPNEEESARLIEREIEKRIRKWDDRPEIRLTVEKVPDYGLFKVNCFYRIKNLGEGEFDFFIGKD